MRRQTELGGHSAGSSRIARLDPLALPVRFTANDAVADERVRHVELHPRTRDPAPCRARHAHRAQRAGQGLPRRFDPAGSRTGRSAGAASRSISSTSIPRSRSSSIPRKTPTTSSPNGNCGRACSACRALVAGSDGEFSEPFPRLGAVRCQGAGAAPPPPLAARQAPPALPHAPPRRREPRRAAGACGRARDHRAELARQRSATRRPIFSSLVLGTSSGW